ncbi:hypothetical protein LSAT2_019293, partial [Lamellibrachia satsuma]
MTNSLRDMAQKEANMTQKEADMTQKEADFLWDEPQQKAFDALKAAVTSTPVLRYYNLDEEQLRNVIQRGWSNDRSGTLFSEPPIIELHINDLPINEPPNTEPPSDDPPNIEPPSIDPQNIEPPTVAESAADNLDVTDTPAQSEMPVSVPPVVHSPGDQDMLSTNQVISV